VTKKVILDVDPGIDDAVALTMALFEPSIDVVAVTATGGNVTPEQAALNVQAIIEQLDPPRWPRIGAGSAPDAGLPAHTHKISGVRGLGSVDFDVVPLQNRHSAEKVISEELRAAPGEITIVALGPLTNIARVVQRDNSLAEMVGSLVIMGGTLGWPGNVTAAAEFNIYCDPQAARFVFRLPTATKILIPLDVTRQVLFGYELLNQLPGEETRAGRFLRKILPFSYRSHHQTLGVEGIFLNDAVALVAAINPELFELEMTAGDVELGGELTTGATVLDRRRNPEWRHNLHVATSVNVSAAMDCIIRGLVTAGGASKDAS
jgi:inosine-uridine nucleoside N-ribohydrolase